MGDDADSGDYYYDFPMRPMRSDSNEQFHREYQQQRVMLQPGDESRTTRETEQHSVQQGNDEDGMGYGRRRHGHRHHHADTSAVPQSAVGGTENTDAQARGPDPMRSGDTQALSSRRGTDPMLRSGDRQALGSRRGTDPMLTSVDTTAFSTRRGTDQVLSSGLTNTDTQARADTETVHQPVEVRSGSAGQMIPSTDTRPPDSYDRVQPLMDMTTQPPERQSQNIGASRKVFGPSKSLKPPSDYVPSPAERLRDSRKFGGFSGPSSRTVPLETIMARRNVFGASKAVVMPPTRRQPPEDQSRAPATHWAGASAGARFGALMAMRQPPPVLPPIKGDSSSTVGAQSQAVDEDDDYSGR